MRYGKINKNDIANGPGVRVSIFVSGCRRHCKGCFNPETWDFNYGELFTNDTIGEILEALAPDHIAGLSILGGDPLEAENIADVMDICYHVKEKYPKKTIWLYTGAKYEDILYFDPGILYFIDVLVDGRFIEDLKDISLVFRGSKNQRLIKVPESVSSGKIIEVKV